jgi:tetratricopeptide (TPR) repeat protein
LTPQSADSAESIRRRNRESGAFPLVVILLITGWAFLPTLQNGFVNWDDAALINNLAYRGLGWPELMWMLAGFHFGKYEPLTWLTFGFDHVVWGIDPFGYHWTTLILHGSSAAGVYLLALRLFSSRRSGNAQSDNGALRIAARLSALVFAIHPLRVEPVAWASARSEILATLFFLCSVLLYLQAISMVQSDQRRALWMFLSVSAYGLSLLSGISGIALPGVLLVLDVYPLGRFGVSGKWLGPEARRLYKEKIPYLLIALAAVTVALIASNQKSSMGDISRAAAMTEIAHGIAAPVFYFWKTIVPFGLSPIYELQGWFLVLGAFAVLALNIWIYFIRKRWPSLVASWVCYLMLLWLIPTSDSFGGQALSDRRTYLPSLPWAVLTGAAAMHYLQAYVNGWIRRWLFGVSAIILLGLGALTSAQTRVWHDSETLWNNAAAGSGASKAHYNLAVLREAQGKYDDAIASYRRVAEIDSRRWDAEEKAALLLEKQGKTVEAVKLFRSAVQINPAAIEARNRLALGLMKQREIGEAVQHLRKVLEFAPERNDARLTLGTILALQGRLTDAIDLFQQAVKFEPGNAKILLNLGQVSAAQGDLNKAIDYFREAVRIMPEDAGAHESLGRALLEQGKRDEAAPHLQEAVRILKSSPVSR